MKTTINASGEISKNVYTLLTSDCPIEKVISAKRIIERATAITKELADDANSIYNEHVKNNSDEKLWITPFHATLKTYTSVKYVYSDKITILEANLKAEKLKERESGIATKVIADSILDFSVQLNA